MKRIFNADERWQRRCACEVLRWRSESQYRFKKQGVLYRMQELVRGKDVTNKRLNLNSNEAASARKMKLLELNWRRDLRGGRECMRRWSG